MLREETVEAGTLALIKKLSADEKLKDFILVGGTALSLQLGHRKSVDIDLFASRRFDPHETAALQHILKP
jgi:predicted nucleotidyltransferase